MSTGITIPALGKPDNVKDAVVTVLASEWPLSAKQIYGRTTDMGLSVSYQAVYKTIGKLMESSVIRKVGNNYLLNDEWIKSIKGFADNIEKRYSKEIATEILKDVKNAKVLNFNSEFEMNTFMLKFIQEKLANAGKDDLCCSYWNRSWWTMIYPKEMYSAFKSAKNKDNMYIVFSDNGVFDKWAAKFCKSFGFNVKCGVKLGYDYDFGVICNEIVQVYRSQKLFDIFDKAVKGLKNDVPSPSILNFIKSVFDIKAGVQVVYLNNEKLARNLSDKVLEVFGKAEAKK